MREEVSEALGSSDNLAFIYYAWLLAHERIDPREMEFRITKNLAWLCRYNKSTPLSELLDCDRDWLHLFGECLGSIVEEENKSAQGK